MKTLTKEQQDIQDELRQIELERAEVMGERRGLLHGLGWSGLTDDEVSWLCNHLKIHGKLFFKPTVEQIRTMIAKGEILKETIKD